MALPPAPALAMTDEQRARLSEMASSSSLPYRVVIQASALLLAGEGVANEEIGRRCGVLPPALLARSIGISPGTAARWAGLTGGNWTAYAADGQD